MITMIMMNSFLKQNLVVKITWISMLLPPLISLIISYLLYYYNYSMILVILLLFEPLHMMYYILVKYYINRYQNLSTLGI